MALQLGQLVSFSSMDSVVSSHRLCPAVFLLRKIRSKDLVICEENRGGLSESLSISDLLHLAVFDVHRHLEVPAVLQCITFVK